MVQCRHPHLRHDRRRQPVEHRLCPRRHHIAPLGQRDPVNAGTGQPLPPPQCLDRPAFARPCRQRIGEPLYHRLRAPSLLPAAAEDDPVHRNRRNLTAKPRQESADTRIPVQHQELIGIEERDPVRLRILPRMLIGQPLRPRAHLMRPGQVHQLSGIIQCPEHLAGAVGAGIVVNQDIVEPQRLVMRQPFDDPPDFVADNPAQRNAFPCHGQASIRPSPTRSSHRQARLRLKNSSVRPQASSAAATS